MTKEAFASSRRSVSDGGSKEVRNACWGCVSQVEFLSRQESEHRSGLVRDIRRQRHPASATQKNGCLKGVRSCRRVGMKIGLEPCPQPLHVACNHLVTYGMRSREASRTVLASRCLRETLVWETASSHARYKLNSVLTTPCGLIRSWACTEGKDDQN